MWKPFANIGSVWFGNAEQNVDKYHWIRQIFWAFESVRKEEQRKFSKSYRKYFKIQENYFLKDLMNWLMNKNNKSMLCCMPRLICVRLIFTKRTFWKSSIAKTENQLKKLCLTGLTRHMTAVFLSSLSVPKQCKIGWQEYWIRFLLQSLTALLKVATTKSKFSKEMLTATEISSVFVTASYICFPTNISILQQNKRQLNSLPLVILIYSVFSGYPNYWHWAKNICRIRWKYVDNHKTRIYNYLIKIIVLAVIVISY